MFFFFFFTAFNAALLKYQSKCYLLNEIGSKIIFSILIYEDTMSPGTEKQIKGFMLFFYTQVFSISVLSATSGPDDQNLTD